MSYLVTRCVDRGAAECLPGAAVTETNAGSSLRHELPSAVFGLEKLNPSFENFDILYIFKAKN